MNYACPGTPRLAALFLLTLVVALAACAGASRTSNSAPVPNSTPVPNSGSQSPSSGKEAVFVANGDSSSIHGFTLDAERGTLIPIPGSPFAVPSAAIKLAAAPAGNFVFATTRTAPFYRIQNPSDLRGLTLSVDRSTGALTLVNSTQLSAVPRHNAIAPSGRFLYAAATSGIMVLSIDPATGAMVEVPQSPFSMQADLNVLAVNPAGVRPAGALLYSTFGQGPPATGGIQGAFLDTAAGTITSTIAPAVLNGNFSTLQPSAIAFHPSGNHVVAVYRNNQLAAYSISPAGTLTQTGNLATSGDGPTAVAFDAEGRFVFVANAGSNAVSVHAFDSANGGLTPVDGSPYSTGVAPLAVAVSPSGFVFTANQKSNTISAFRLEPNGTLSSLAELSVGTTPVDVITTRF